MSAVADTQTANTSEDFFLPFKQRHADAVRALGIFWLLESLEAAQRQEGCTFQDVINALASLRVKRKKKNEPIAVAAAHNEKLITLSKTMYETFKIKLTADFRVDIATGDSVHRLFLKGETKKLPADVTEKLSEVTVSHILGEAFELYCAISFKERIIPIVLQDRPELPPSARTMCKVEKVFMSDYVVEDQLKWVDQDIREPDYQEKLIQDLIASNDVANEDAVKKFVNTLAFYMKDDKGFDILVQLREIDSRKIHFIVCQCKFRSPREAEDAAGSIDISSYVGKHADIMEQARAMENVLCPFHWLATNTDFKLAEGYFSKLIEKGLLAIQGASALVLQAKTLGLIGTNIKFLQEWKEGVRRQREKILSEMKPRVLMDHQNDAVEDICQYFEKYEPRNSQETAAAAAVNGNSAMGGATAAAGGGGGGASSSDNLGRYASIIMATGSGKTLTAYKATVELERRHFLENNIRRPSLHVSPMIRLVFQNAHEWLAEDIAKWVQDNREKPSSQVNYSDFPIYYTVCSSQDDSSRGCTSLSTIHMGELAETLERHAGNGTLGRCRFFTTYDAGSLFWMKVRQFCLDKYGDPLHKVFGVAVRDEAHTAAGLGSKPHSAVLNVPSHFALSFTATPKIQLSRVEETIKDDDKIQAELKSEDKMTYLHLKREIMLPSSAIGDAKDMMECPVPSSNPLRHPFDFLSENLLFEKIEAAGCYDWGYFQRQAVLKDIPIVVFFVQPVEKIIDSTDAADANAAVRGKYDVLHDPFKKVFRFFGPLFPSSVSELTDRTTRGSEVAQCFGVTEDFKTLCKPLGEKRGLVIHDMTSFGPGNYIGPIIHTLSYQKCISNKGLCGPRLVMLKPKAMGKSEYNETGISKNTLAALLGRNEKPKSPESITWRLTINDRVVKGTAQHFRAMQQLLTCFMARVVNRVVVFCTSGEKAQECMDIFNALLHREEALRFDAEKKSQFYVCRIYSSDVHTKEEMSYGEQQDHLLRFGRSKYGVVFNVRLVGIGVDLPGIDAVQIVSPNDSVSKIAQAYGRAMRRDSRFVGEKKATFIIPSVSPFVQHWKKELEENAKDPSEQIPHLLWMEPYSPPESGSVAAPVVHLYEHRFHLQVKLAKLMISEKTEILGERFIGTRCETVTDNATKPNTKKDYEGESVSGLIKKITMEGEADKLIPILGPELSKILLNAWEAVVVVDLKKDNEEIQDDADGDDETMNDDVEEHVCDLLTMPDPPAMEDADYERACKVLAAGLARSFGKGDPTKWCTTFSPLKIQAGGMITDSVSLAVNNLKRCNRWNGCKADIRTILSSGQIERITFSLESTLDKLMAQLDKPIHSKEKAKTGNTPATGATPEYTPANTPPPGGSNSNGAGPSSAGGTGAGTGQGVSNPKRRKLSDAFEKST